MSSGLEPPGSSGRLDRFRARTSGRGDQPGQGLRLLAGLDTGEQRRDRHHPVHPAGPAGSAWTSCTHPVPLKAHARTRPTAGRRTGMSTR